MWARTKAGRRGQARRLAAGWIGSARFSKGGAAANGRSGLTVHAINPEIGTESSLDARFRLLRAAIQAAPPMGGVTIYLTSGGFFGLDVSGKTPSWIGLRDREVAGLKRKIQTLAHELGPSVGLLVGVDTDGEGWDQQLWRLRSGDEIQIRQREDEPRDLRLGRFRVRGYVCGAILGQSGTRLDPARDLSGVDVVLDAAHNRLNRTWSRTPKPTAKWFGFHQMLRRIGRRAGAVFAHAHGPDFDTKVRDCDNWVVYRSAAPFPGERQGRRIYV